MKRLVSALLAVIMMFSVLPLALAGCAAPLSEGLEYTSNGDGTCTLIGTGSFEGTALRVPDYSPGGELVVAVEAFSFSGNKRLVSVSLPNGVRSIGTEAFSGCTALEWVEFGTGLETIEAFAFSGCSAMKYFTAADGFGAITVALDIKPLLNAAVAEKLKERDRYVPMSIQLLELPDATRSVGEGAFANCTALDGCLWLEEGLQVVGANAFRGCTSLDYAYVDSAVLSMGKGVFEGARQVYLMLEHESVPFSWHENWDSAGSATVVLVRNAEWTEIWQSVKANGVPLYESVKKQGIPFGTTDKNGALIVNWGNPTMLWAMGWLYLHEMGIT